MTTHPTQPSPPTRPPDSQPPDSQPPGGPTPQGSGLRRSLLGISIAVVGGALAVFAWNGPIAPAGEDDVTLRPAAQVDRVEVTVDAGAIEILPGDDVRVEVTGRSGRGEGRFATDSELSDGHFHVTVSCSRWRWLGSCETPVTVVVPAGIQVVATAQAGTITASGLDSGADLRTSAGRIAVHDLAGEIRLRSEAGSIRGTVSKGSVDAATSVGPIAITVVEDVTRLTARTEAGPIELVVPDTPYRVDAGTTLGRTEIDVATSVDADRIIEARSEVGKVVIRTGNPGSTDE